MLCKITGSNCFHEQLHNLHGSNSNGLQNRSLKHDILIRGFAVISNSCMCVKRLWGTQTMHTLQHPVELAGFAIHGGPMAGNPSYCSMPSWLEKLPKQQTQPDINPGNFKKHRRCHSICFTYGGLESHESIPHNSFCWVWSPSQLCRYNLQAQINMSALRFEAVP